MLTSVRFALENEIIISGERSTYLNFNIINKLQ